MDRNVTTARKAGTKASIEINFQVYNGDGGFVYLDITHLTTIDRGDVAHVIKKMEEELVRLQSSRTFTSGNR